MSDTEELERQCLLDCQAIVLKYGARLNHAEHVAGLCDSLLEATWAFNWLQPSDRATLLAAAYLHNVGHVIDADYHHRHSRYIVLHDTCTRGWTEGMRTDVGLIVRNHRKRNPRGLEGLKKPALKRIRALTAILRLADQLDRNHTQKTEIEAIYAPLDLPRVTIILRGAALADLKPHLQRKGQWAADVWRRELEFLMDGERFVVAPAFTATGG